MIFEASVIDVQEATYTVKNVTNGKTYQNCKLCAMGVSDWCVSKDDYVLCTMSEYGQVYIMGEIKGRKASTEGIRLGDSDVDKLVVTQNATLIHVRDINTTMIDDTGLECFYKKATIKGFGTVIEINEDEISITVPGNVSGGSGIVITPTEIKLFGEEQGGILKGNDAQKQLDALADKLNAHINSYLGHGHTYFDPTTSVPYVVSVPSTTANMTVPPSGVVPAAGSTKVNIDQISKPNVQSSKVKSS
jgi:hypothetical protein